MTDRVESEESETARADDGEDASPVGVSPATDGGEERTEEHATDGGEDESQPADHATDANDEDEDADRDTVPEVKLTLYQLSVGVTGQTTDDLEDVEASATRLMDYLVEKAGDLEDHPDDRGLG